MGVIDEKTFDLHMHIWLQGSHEICGGCSRIGKIALVAGDMHYGGGIDWYKPKFGYSIGMGP